MDVLEIATRISTPLALAGLIVGALFLVARQIIALGIFPRLNRVLGADLLKTIVDRLFVLAMTAMILGFIAYMARFLPGGDEDLGYEREHRLAVDLLDKLYRRDFVAAYNMFTQSLRQATTYSQFAKDSAKSHQQFEGPPTYRHLKNTMPAAGFVSLVYTAEFDEASIVQEVVTFAQQGKQRELWRFDFWPESWPLTTPSQVVSERTASEVINKVARLAGGGRSYAGSYTPRDPWEVVVGGVGRKVAAHTCDVNAQEESTSVAVHLRKLLGGCSLESGKRLSVWGRIAQVSADEIELESVRFVPLQP